MKSLNDSAIFNQLVCKPNLINSMKIINISTDKILESDIQTELNNINRRINYGTKMKALNYLSNDNIVLINKEGLKIPKYLSVFGIKKSNKLHMIVNLNPYMNNSGEIYTKTLFALLQNALISYELATNWDGFINSIELMKESCISYSRLVTKIFDKLFALDLDKIKSDFISFIFAKFFLITICGKNESETVDNLAFRACFNRTTQKTILGLEEEYEINYSDIFTLFKFLERIEGLNDVNIRSFIENYVRMYGEGAIMSLDYLPAFFHTIMSSSIAGGLVKDAAVDNVSGKFNSKIYTSIVKII